MQFRDLKTQYVKYKEEIDVAVQEVMGSAGFIGGPVVKTLGSDPHCFRVLKRNNYNFT